MSAQPAAPRKSPSLSTSDDAFAVRAMEFTAWARANVRLIVGSAVVLALLVGGLLYYRMYQANREERAATEYMRVQQTAASGNFALATRDLEAYVRRYEGTAYADEAQITLAQLYMTQDQPAKAVETLDGAVGRIDDSAVGPQAALLLGAAQLESGDRDAALATYLATAEAVDLSLFKVQALMNAATLRGDAGDHAGAAEIYRQLMELAEEGSLDRQAYEMRAAEAEARAAAK